MPRWSPVWSLGATHLARPDLVLVGTSLDGPGVAPLLEAVRVLVERSQWAVVPERTVMVALWSGRQGVDQALASGVWPRANVRAALVVGEPAGRSRQPGGRVRPGQRRWRGTVSDPPGRDDPVGAPASTRRHLDPPVTTAWTTDVATADAARAVRLTLLWGLDGVVLRTVGGGRVPNVNEAPLRRRLDEAELPVVAIDPGLFEGAASARAGWLDGLDALDEVAAFCTRMGCPVVRVGALAAGERPGAADALRQAGDRAARHGLRLAVRNEAGTGVATGAALAALLAEIDHPAVGADWRPADAWDLGEARADGLAALVEAGHVPLVVGVDDGRGELGADTVEGVPGGDTLAALARAGFDGPLVLDALPPPVRTSGLASATALIRAARQATRGR